jgi:hypothetical protein
MPLGGAFDSAVSFIVFERQKLPDLIDVLPLNERANIVDSLTNLKFVIAVRGHRSAISTNLAPMFESFRQTTL